MSNDTSPNETRVFVEDVEESFKATKWIDLPFNGLKVQVKTNPEWPEVAALRELNTGSNLSEDDRKNLDKFVVAIQVFIVDWNFYKKKDEKKAPVTYDNVMKLGGINLMVLFQELIKMVGEETQIEVKKKSQN